MICLSEHEGKTFNNSYLIIELKINYVYLNIVSNYINEG